MRPLRLPRILAALSKPPSPSITTIIATNPSRLFSQKPQPQHPSSPSKPQPQPTQDDAASSPPSHYALFPTTLPHGPPPHGPFTINPRLLRREFLSLQAKHHPDKHTDQPADEARRLSAVINEAYTTLADPLLRAEYLLAQHGRPTASDEAAAADRPPEPDLLAAVMEAHEIIEEARSPRDIESLAVQNDERIAASEALLERAFAARDLDAAHSEAVRLKYWVNIRRAIRDWEEGKDPLV